MDNDEALRPAVRAAMMRYARNPREFAPARAVKLPADKAEFPKLAILDVNHWIALARVHHGKSQDAAAAAALTALRAAKDAERIVIPLTDINLGEAGASADLDRRRRLATFMVDLSGNYSIAGYPLVEPLEINNVLASVYAKLDKAIPVRLLLLQWSAVRAFPIRRVTAGDPKLDAIMNEVLDYPEIAVEAIVHATRVKQVRDSNTRENESMKRIEAIRVLDQDMDPEAKHRLELSNLRTDVLDRLLPMYDLDPKVFHEALSIEDNRMRFWHAVPGVDVLTKLFLERDKNRDAKTHRNDGRDLSMLQVAIPYANILVAENLWAHLANANRARVEVRNDGDLGPRACAGHASRARLSRMTVSLYAVRRFGGLGAD